MLMLELQQLCGKNEINLNWTWKF